MIDIAIIGAGIVGLSAAWQIKSRHPDASVLVIEKEAGVARHQSGRNSGVVHSGLYYEPGGLKARFCKAGAEATVDFCRTHGLPCERRGKLVVATSDVEHERLHALRLRGRQNGLETTLLTAREMQALEPHVIGNAALLVPSTRIVDFVAICNKMAALYRHLGGRIQFDCEAIGIEEVNGKLRIRLASGEALESRFLVACGGLAADRLVRMQRLDPGFRIVPYRGEYYRLPAKKSGIVRHLIYPVPDPALPFLGVHLTPMIDGSLTVGPSALQGWKREGYGRINFDLRDTWDLLTYPGFWRASSRFLRTGLAEIRNGLWKPAYLRRIQRYCPGIFLDDLLPHPVGIRAQAVLPNGDLAHDFLFAQSPRSLHVCNAPSPAATSAIPIGAYVCDKIDGMLANN